MQAGRGQLSELGCAQESAQESYRLSEGSQGMGKSVHKYYGNSRKLTHPVCGKGQGHNILLIVESSLQLSNVLLVGDKLNTERQKANEGISNGVTADTS